MKSLIPSVCLLGILSAHLANAGDVTQAYREGKFDRAAQEVENTHQSSVVDYYMGRMRLYGYGVLKNNQLALKHLRRAAEKGHLKAQNMLARYELLIQHEPKAALHWFKKAADQGDIQAQLYTAGAYLFGYGAKKNPTLARRYYIMAAKAGNPIAQYTLADYFLSSKHRKNRKLGLIWLNKAVEQGNPKAKLLLASLYTQGKGVPKDTVIARQWINQVIKQEPVKASYQLGLLEQQAGHLEKARDLMKKAAEQNDVESQIALAKLYLNKDASFHDPQTGFLWMLKAAQQSSRDAQKALSNLYKEGIGVAKDENLAKAWQDKSKKKSTQQKIPAKEQLTLWLSNGKSQDFLASGYSLDGIWAPWKNKDAIHEQNYNPAPQLLLVGKEAIFKPQFSAVLPEEVPISEYYNAIANSFNTLNHQAMMLPRYSTASLSMVEVNEVDETATKKDTPRVQQEVSIQLFEVKPNTHIVEPQSKPTLSDLRRQALLGNAKSQFQLGQMYEYGIGVHQNIQKAMEYYLLASDQNDLRAKYNMGLIFLLGKGVVSDPEMAESWFKEAAFQGNPEAQFALARLTEYGFAKPSGEALFKQNEDESLGMYYLAASNDFGPAQFRLAELLVRSKNNQMDLASLKKRNDMIKALYEGAVHNGIEQAALPLAYFYAMEGNAIKQEQAYKVAEKQAQQGSPQGALLLGLMYDKGIGVKRDVSTALDWYQQTTDNPVGSFILGTYLIQGNKIAKDKEEGRRLIKKSADSGFSYAMHNLSLLQKEGGEDFLPTLRKAKKLGNSKAGILLADYYLSQGSEPEKMKEARDIYQHFAEKGDRLAQLKLGFMIENGLGGAANAYQASKWYQLAANQNQPVAKYLLSRLYFTGDIGSKPDYTQAKYLLKNAAGLYPPAAVALGFIYDTVDDNYQQAQTAYQIAAQGNNSVGLYNLGLIYQLGKGVAVDNQKANQLFMQAAKQNHAQAMVQIAKQNFNGSLGYKDEEKALEWYQRAAQHGDREALYQLGLLTETGVATSLDAVKAFNFYQEAAKKGNAKAMLALARMYQYGQGVTKDKQKAFDIYQTLAKIENPYAQFQLATLYYEGLPGVKPNQKKAMALLAKAQKNGYPEASNVLNWLEAQSQVRHSYIVPIHFGMLQPYPEQDADRMFLDALNEWNRGDALTSRKILDSLLIRFPNYSPAKKAHEQLGKTSLPKKLS